MAFSARRSLASTLSHHLSRRLHPSISHLLPSHDHSSDPSPSASLPTQPLPSTVRQPSSTQTLSLLPFGLHLAAHRNFSSSSFPSPGEIEVGGVISDAVSSAPAPFPGEVAAAAADSSLPVAALQHLMDAVHSFTGLNWWVCIALTTLLIRTATIPLLLNQMRSTVKLNAMRPEIEAIKTEVQNSVDPQSMEEGRRRISELFIKHGVNPFTPLKGLFIQGPIFISFFFAMSNMVEKVPSFKGGGAFWFTDLTTPDDLYILPVLSSLTFLAVVELNMQEGMEGNPMANTIKNYSRGLAFLAVPFTMSFPKAIFCYWVTSNLFSLVYGFVLRKPVVRNYLDLPPLEPAPAPVQQPTLEFFSASKAISSADSSISIKGPEPSSSSEQSTSALGHRIRNLEKEAKSRGKSQSS